MIDTGPTPATPDHTQATPDHTQTTPRPPPGDPIPPPDDPKTTPRQTPRPPQTTAIPPPDHPETTPPCLASASLPRYYRHNTRMCLRSGPHRCRSARCTSAAHQLSARCTLATILDLAEMTEELKCTLCWDPLLHDGVGDEDHRAMFIYCRTLVSVNLAGLPALYHHKR